MILTKQIIKNFTTDDYLKYRKEIKEYFKNKRINKKTKDKDDIQYKSDSKKSSKIIKNVSKPLEGGIVYKDGMICPECLEFKFWNDYFIYDGDFVFKKCIECCQFENIIGKIENRPKKFVKSFKSRIYKALRGAKKCDNIEKLLGCSVEDFKKHMEKQFIEGMSWNNYGLGGWWIDHIIPCDFFNLNNPEEQRKCFHWSNHQPLWWDDNIRKSNKITL